MSEIRLIKNRFDNNVEIFNVDNKTLNEIVDSLNLAESQKSHLKIAKLNDDLEIVENIDKEFWDEVAIGKFLFCVNPAGGGAKDWMLIFPPLWLAVESLNLAFKAISWVTGLFIESPTTNKSSYSSMNRGADKPSISTFSNEAKPYEPIPRVYGKVKMFADLAAKPYVENVGSNQYLRGLFTFGHGPVKISDIKIGETPLTSFKEVEYEIREGWEDDEPITLYTQRVNVDEYNYALGNGATFTTTTPNNTQEIAFSINYPKGCYALWGSSKVQYIGMYVYFRVDYREIGTETWKSQTFSPLDVSLSPITKELRIANLPKAAYEVRITRTGELAWTTDFSKLIAWYADTNVVGVRTTQYIDPVQTKGLSLLALRIRATNQLNGTIDNLSAIVESYNKVYTQTVSQETENKIQKYAFSGAANLNRILEYSSPDNTSQIKVSFNFPNGIYTIIPPDRKDIAKVKYKITYTTNGRTNVLEREYSGDSTDPIQDTITLNSATPDNWVLTVERILEEAFYENRPVNETVDATCFVNLETSYSTTKNVYAQTYQWKLNQHPAWHLVEILTGHTTQYPISVNRIDFTSLLDWVSTYPDMSINAIIDYEVSKLELAKKFCSAGRARFVIKNGKYGVVLDKPGKIAKGAITPRNSYDFSFSRQFQDEIHGYKVTYIEPDLDWEEQQVIVYADGYNEDNAALFEELEAWGTTNYDQAYKYGRYMLAQRLLRPDTYTVKQDFESMIFNIGDIVNLSYDIINVGVGAARIKELKYDIGDKLETIVIDDLLAFDQSKTYNVVVRAKTGELVTKAISPTDGDTIDFLSPFDNTLISVGDLCYFGETNREQIRALITKIEPDTDYSATLTLVDEAPAIYEAEDKPIPPYDPGMTDKPIYNESTVPDKPVVTALYSDERTLQSLVGGGFACRIQVDLEPYNGTSVPVDSVQFLYGFQNSSSLTNRTYPIATSSSYLLDGVFEENVYDIQVRYISKYGIASDWTYILGYQVVGKTSVPDDVEEVWLEGYNLLWEYPDPPVDLAGYEVYWCYGSISNIASKVKAHEGLCAGSPFDISALPHREITLMVYAIDSSGNSSVNPGFVTTLLQPEIYDNNILEIDYKKLGWEGYKENALLRDGNLVAEDARVFYPALNDNFYKQDVQETFYEAESYKQMTYAVNYQYDGFIDDSFVRLDFESEGTYNILYRFGERPEGVTDEVWYSGPQWKTMPERLPITNERVWIKLVFLEGPNRGILKEFKLIVDANDTTETVSNFEVPVEGARVPLKNKFKLINKVFLTIFSSSGAAYAKVFDYNVELGPLVQIFDSNNQPIAGTVNVDVRGYK